ncbi:hypothetical protein NW804_00575 [Synechococcus sp. WC10meta]
MLDRWLAGVPGLDPICRPSAQGSLVGGAGLSWKPGWSPPGRSSPD